MNAALWPRYHYAGDVTRCIDGDTVRVRLSLGLSVGVTVDLRLAGIDAPEVVGATRAAGLAARAHLESLVGGRRVYVRTYRDRRSFTRYVADLFVVGPDGTLTDVADEMVAAGHATRVGLGP